MHWAAGSHGHAGMYAPSPLLPLSKVAAPACVWQWCKSSGLAPGSAAPVLQGQVSCDDVASLCVVLEQPATLNTTFEVSAAALQGSSRT